MEYRLDVVVPIRSLVQDQKSKVDLGVGRKHGSKTSELRDIDEPIYNKGETLKSEILQPGATPFPLF